MANNELKLTDAMVDAFMEFMRKASYLRHPDVEYFGESKGDTEAKWNRRLATKALWAVLDAAAPAQAEPSGARGALSDAEIERIWREHTVPVFGMNGINANVFARAIEARILGQQGGGES